MSALDCSSGVSCSLCLSAAYGSPDTTNRRSVCPWAKPRGERLNPGMAFDTYGPRGLGRESAAGSSHVLVCRLPGFPLLTDSFGELDNVPVAVSQVNLKR